MAIIILTLTSSNVGMQIAREMIIGHIMEKISKLYEKNIKVFHVGVELYHFLQMATFCNKRSLCLTHETYDSVQQNPLRALSHYGGHHRTNCDKER